MGSWWWARSTRSRPAWGPSSTASRMAAEAPARAGFLPTDLEPKLLTTLREGYSARDLGRDALAGLVVGVVALPLAIAFAIASGVRPEQGLYTAIVAGFLISAFGGSRVQIGGPTGALVVIFYGIVQQYGGDGLTVATIMAGAVFVPPRLAPLRGPGQITPLPRSIPLSAGPPPF